MVLGMEKKKVSNEIFFVYFDVQIHRVLQL